MVAVTEEPDALTVADHELVIVAPEGRLNPTDQLVQLDDVLLSMFTLAVKPPAHWLEIVIVTPQLDVVTGAAVVVAAATVVVGADVVVVAAAAVVVVAALVVVVGADVVVVGATVVVVGATVVVGAAAAVVVGDPLFVEAQGCPFRVNEVAGETVPESVPWKPKDVLCPAANEPL